MPLAQSFLSARAGLTDDGTNTPHRALDAAYICTPLSAQAASFDEPIFDQYCDDIMPSHEPAMAAASPPLSQAGADDLPELPPKSALRSSRVMPDTNGLKLGLARSNPPHDIYLSSEEDASSDAGDFSDCSFGDDDLLDDDDDNDDDDNNDNDSHESSSVKGPASPASSPGRAKRRSYEVTARAVSVVFSGKPLMVDLPAARKRPASTSVVSTLGSRRPRASLESTASAVSAKPAIPTARSSTMSIPMSRSATPESSISSRRSLYKAVAQLSQTSLQPQSSSQFLQLPQQQQQQQQQQPQRTSRDSRRSFALSELLTKKNKQSPPFLSIDPYADKALPVPKGPDSLESELLTPLTANSIKTPRTPTATLMRGVARSFSLLKKRSRPNLKERVGRLREETIAAE
ncbi:hypothetical protein VTJ83DRAFT_1928 [Remersonia thermophila]|uniref:Uncharacterized protein n=1 Tax=Remersonia thermophila TaxID=72144 RepID=A0ABR4DJJ6_9PEZI